ncbi:hypothetical protein ACLKA6_004999 [Drosophila palustris]
MRGPFYLFLVLLLVSYQTEAATLVYHQPTALVYHHPPVLPEEQQHPGYTIVAPLTKIAHVTYDSVPVSHTPFEHVPLFQRIGHVKGIRL